ncbi:MAG: type II toxin-antitoxin system RelE/ParE family toxin [Pirellulales bacterium]
MAHHVFRKPEVRRDLVELAEYISKDNLDAAARFLDAVEKTFEFLAANSESGQLCNFDDPECADLRVWPVEQFRNYLVFYQPISSGVDIVRVLHGARDFAAIFDPRT